VSEKMGACPLNDDDDDDDDEDEDADVDAVLDD